MTVNDNIISWLAGHRFGDMIHFTGAINVTARIPVNTDIIYFASRNNNISTAETAQLTLTNIVGGANTAMYIQANDRKFINNMGVLEVGTYNIDAWIRCKKTS